MENSNVRKHHPRANDVSAETRATDHAVSAATHQAVNDEHSNAIDRGFKTQSLRADLLAAPHPSSTNLDGGQTHPTPSPLLLAASLPTPKIDVAPDNCQSLNNALLAAPHPNRTNRDAGQNHSSSNRLLLVAQCPTPIDLDPGLNSPTEKTHNARTLVNIFKRIRFNRIRTPNSNPAIDIFFSLMLLLTAACSSKSSPANQPPVTKYAVSTAPLCDKTASSFVLAQSGGNIPAAGGPIGRTIQLARSFTKTTVAATLQPGVTATTANYEVTVPPGLPDGEYTVEITEAGQVTSASGTVKIIGPPTITNKTDFLGCIAASPAPQPIAIAITGTNLTSTATIKLQKPAGSSLSVTIANKGVDAFGTVLNAEVPPGVLSSLDENTPYSLVVETSPGCSVTSQQTFTRVSAPSVMEVVYGPKLYSNKVSRQLMSSVQISGTNLFANTTVKIGSTTLDKSAITPDASNTQLKVELKPNTLEAGDNQAIVVQNGASCSTTFAKTLSVDGSTPIAGEVHFNPSAVANNEDGKSFLDIYGLTNLKVGGDANQQLAVVLNRQSDPLQPVNWTALPPTLVPSGSPPPVPSTPAALYVKLDAKADTVRFLAPKLSGSAGPLPSGNYDASVLLLNTTTNSVIKEVFIPRGLAVTANLVPRIVYKDKDWVTNSGSDSLSVYGCNFVPPAQAPTSGNGLPVSFYLVGKDGTQLQTALNGTVKAASTWAKNKFQCTSTNIAAATNPLEEVTFTNIPSGISPGVYRLRFKVPAGTAPIVTPATASDDSYPFVVYGQNGPSSIGAFQPAQAGTTPAVLGTARKNAQAAVAADATGRKYVYVIGGSMVSSLDPSDGGGITTYEYSALDPDHGLVGFETRPNGRTDWPIMSPGESFVETYGGALLSDGTLLYWLGGTSSSSTDCTASGPNNCKAMRQASVVDPTATATLPFGQLGSFIKKGDLAAGTYGAKALLVSRPNSATPSVNVRKILYFGGYTKIDTLGAAGTVLQSVQLDDTGIMQTPNSVGGGTREQTAKPLDVKLSPQAPGALTFVRATANPANPATDTLYASLGVFAGGMVASNPTVEAQAIQSVTVMDRPVICTNKVCDDNWEYMKDAGSPKSVSSTDPMLLNPKNCGTAGTDPCSESGFAAFSFGPKVFALGGTTRNTVDTIKLWGSNTARKEGYHVDVTATTASANNINSLTVRRSLSSSVVVAPNFIVISGVICLQDVDSTAAACGSDPSSLQAANSAEIATSN